MLLDNLDNVTYFYQYPGDSKFIWFWVLGPYAPHCWWGFSMCSTDPYTVHLLCLYPISNIAYLFPYQQVALSFISSHDQSRSLTQSSSSLLVHAHSLFRSFASFPTCVSVAGWDIKTACPCCLSSLCFLPSAFVPCGRLKLASCSRHVSPWISAFYCQILP